MIRKTLMITSLAAAYLMSAQDVSTIKNTADVYSSSTFQGSAKYNAMAGSMGALGGEYSVINSNPAGIGVSIANDFSATLGIQSQNNVSRLNNQSVEYKTNNTDITNSGGIAVFPVSSSTWKFVNVGVSYSNRSLDDYTETPGNSNVLLEYVDDNQNVQNFGFAGHAYNRYGNLNKTGIAVGGNYANRIYVGVGVNFHNSVLDQFDSAAFTNATGSVEYFDKQYTPFSESASGFSASVGVIGKINPNFRVGAAVETPTWWNIERIYNAYPISTYGSYYEDRKLSSPLKATLSAAYVANKNFSVNVDYSLGLTKPKYKVYGEAETVLNDFFSDRYTSNSEVKIGAEYRLDAFRLRAGYGYAASPFDAVSVSAFDNAGSGANRSFDNMFVSNRNTVGAGIGYDFRSFYIDAAYQYVNSDYSNPFLYGSQTAETGYYSGNTALNSSNYLVSDVESTQNNFFVTLGWKF